MKAVNSIKFIKMRAYGKSINNIKAKNIDQIFENEISSLNVKSNNSINPKTEDINILNLLSYKKSHINNSKYSVQSFKKKKSFGQLYDISHQHTIDNNTSRFNYNKNNKSYNLLSFLPSKLNPFFNPKKIIEKPYGSLDFKNNKYLLNTNDGFKDSKQGLKLHLLTTPRLISRDHGVKTPLNSSPITSLQIMSPSDMTNFEVSNISDFIKHETIEPLYKRNYLYSKILKGFIGKPINSNTQLLFKSKSISYSFNKYNNIYNFLSSTNYIECLLKDFFLTLSTVISRPLYIIRKDKILIRLFVFLSPKISSKLKLHTSLNKKFLWDNITKYQTKYNNLEILPYLHQGNSLISLNNQYEKTNSFFNKNSNSSFIFNSSAIKGENNRVKGLVDLKNENLHNLEHLNEKMSINSYFSIFKSKLESLSLILSDNLKKKVEIEIIKIQYPFQNSYMLGQILGFNANKYNFYRMIHLLRNKVVVKNPSQDIWYTKEKGEELAESKLKRIKFQPSSYLPPLFSLNMLNSKFIKFNSNKKDSSYLSGLSVRLAGRLLTQSIRPRFTVQKIQYGSFARVKVDYMEKSRFTSKNKRGAFSFTVMLSHIIAK